MFRIEELVADKCVFVADVFLSATSQKDFQQVVSAILVADKQMIL